MLYDPLNDANYKKSLCEALIAATAEDKLQWNTAFEIGAVAKDVLWGWYGTGDKNKAHFDESATNFIWPLKEGQEYVYSVQKEHLAVSDVLMKNNYTVTIGDGKKILLKLTDQHLSVTDKNSHVKKLYDYVNNYATDADGLSVSVLNPDKLPIPPDPDTYIQHVKGL